MKRKSGNAAAGEPIQQHLCSQVAVLRKKRRWTLERLSDLSGVSRSMLSQIERNRANPTLTVAYRIAKAFGISLNEMIDQPAESSQIETHRASETTWNFRTDYNCRIRLLSPRNLERDVEFYEVVIFPGKNLPSAPHVDGTREIVQLQQGAVRITSGADRTELGVGDSAHYAGDKPHQIDNIGETDAVLYMVNVYQRG